MPRRYTHVLLHVICATKGRLPLLKAEMKSRLFSYMGAIVRESGGKSYSINGPQDHVHMLISVPVTLPIADLMRVVKSKSSKWIHEQWPQSAFAWQAGYSAFSVSHSNLERVKAYIEGQEEHHRRVPFREELVKFLRKHEIEFDERYLWN